MDPQANAWFCDIILSPWMSDFANGSLWNLAITLILSRPLWLLLQPTWPIHCGTIQDDWICLGNREQCITLIDYPLLFTPVPVSSSADTNSPPWLKNSSSSLCIWEEKEVLQVTIDQFPNGHLNIISLRNIWTQICFCFNTKLGFCHLFGSEQ